MGCDRSRRADCSRRAVLRRRRRGPAPIAVLRVAGTMRSADDAERRQCCEGLTRFLLGARKDICPAKTIAVLYSQGPL